MRSANALLAIDANGTVTFMNRAPSC